MHHFSKALVYIVFLLSGFGAAAQSATTPKHSYCQRISNGPEHIILASTDSAKSDAQDNSTLRITYISHASFRIETPDGLEISTDYTGFDGSFSSPDIATMNTIHDGHFTLAPDPQIPHVLHGWKDIKSKEIADHYLRLGETIIRNVTTDFDAPHTGFRPDENSIFVFEIAGLCIGHLGHLHQIPTDDQFAAIGQLDILLFPVSGLRHFGFEGMEDIINRVGANLILPMHWYDMAEFRSFVALIKGNYPIDGRNENSALLSSKSLPNQPTMLILTPETSFGLFPE